MCARSNLKIADANSQVAICCGYYDEDAGMRVPACSAVSLSLDKEAPRLQPWFMHPPTDDEKHVLDQLDEQAKSGKIVDGADNTSHEQEISAMMDEAQKVRHIRIFRLVLHG